MKFHPHILPLIAKATCANLNQWLDMKIELISGSIS